MAALVRLQKFLADAGVASRRASEGLIREGRVAVNGRVVSAMGFKVDPARDRVCVDGRPVSTRGDKSPPPVYIMLHKPPGVLSAAADARGRETVTEWVRRHGGPQVRLFPVGRLDLDSEGLVLLTNDGALAHTLMHPSFEVAKVYRVRVRGRMGDDAAEALRRGVALEDGPTAPARVRVVRRTERSSDLEVTLHEGRKRQLRRMCQAVGYQVLRLVRVRLGPLALGSLPRGAWRYLSPEEVRRLKAAAAAGEAKAHSLQQTPRHDKHVGKSQDGRTEG